MEKVLEKLVHWFAYGKCLATIRVMLHNIPISLLPFSPSFLAASRRTLPGAKVRCCTQCEQGLMAGRFEMAVAGSWGTNPNLFT
jgi:hypothetical protein